MDNVIESEFGDISSKIYLQKASPLSSSDAGFCSDSSVAEEEFLLETTPCPTIEDEDHIEIKIKRPQARNKRKLLEPTKVLLGEEPLRKRVFRCKEIYNYKTDYDKSDFKPWNRSINNKVVSTETTTLNTSAELPQHPRLASLDSPSELLDSRQTEKDLELKLKSLYTNSRTGSNFYEERTKKDLFFRYKPSNDQLKPNHKLYRHTNLDPDYGDTFPSTSKIPELDSTNNHHETKNYKHMTKERRIEANARERTRVHTISAAFDTLRKSIPSYSNTQKLSKLSVLRVSCQYILLLSRIAGLDYSHDESQPSISECTELLTKSIQSEKKTTKKKDGL